MMDWVLGCCSSYANARTLIVDVCARWFGTLPVLVVP